MSDFYDVEQWTFKVDEYSKKDVLIHAPCQWEVHRARLGDKWVCVGCYEEPPQAIQDVIALGRPWQGWEEIKPLNWPTSPSFYLGNNFYLAFQGIESFYLTTVNKTTDSITFSSSWVTP